MGIARMGNAFTYGYTRSVGFVQISARDSWNYYPLKAIIARKKSRVGGDYGLITRYYSGRRQFTRNTRDYVCVVVYLAQGNGALLVSERVY